jgi:hypothetical protein
MPVISARAKFPQQFPNKFGRQCPRRIAGRGSRRRPLEATPLSAGREFRPQEITPFYAGPDFAGI